MKGKYLHRSETLVQITLEDWFEMEVFNAHNLKRGWKDVTKLFNDLEQSEVAKTIGIEVFIDVYLNLYVYKTRLYEIKRYRRSKLSSLIGECYAALDNMEVSISKEVLPNMSISNLEALLKALNKWKLDRKIATKLEAIKEDFK